MTTDACPGCTRHVHASESDDLGRCASCAEAAGEPHVTECYACPTLAPVATLVDGCCAVCAPEHARAL